MEKKAFTIFNASAGAGKTHTLVKEYLKVLLGYSYKDDAYRSVLAITFTNKAVNEMKSRIVSCIYAFSLKEIPQKEYALLEQIVQETSFTEAYIREKSKRILKNIIHNYAGFDISTIDKFTHKVIRSFAFDLNLPFHFEVSLDTEALLQEAVDALISKAGVDDELTKLLIDFSIGKADEDKSWDITHELMDIGRLLLNENNKQELEAFKDVGIKEFTGLKKWLEEQLVTLQGKASGFAQNALNLLAEHNVDLKSFKGGYFPKHLSGIIEGNFNNANKKYYNSEDIAINKTSKDKDTIEMLIPGLLTITHHIYRCFGKIYFYEAFLKNLVPLSLLNSIGTEINRIQDEQQILSISQFNSIIYEELKNQPAPFIYERLGEKYRHFFIDEFQDTSEMQWQNLIPLIDNALSGEDIYGKHGSLMIVGDPKQAIYRWRGGKAEQFMELSGKLNPFSNPSKETLSLDTNYRSFSEVVKFNNGIFGFLAGEFENESYGTLYRDHSFQYSNSKKGGFVNISFVNQDVSPEEDITKDDLYLEQVLHTIETVVAQGFGLGDIVVLTRKSKDGIKVADYLTKNGIRILSSETLLINNAVEVQLLLNLFRFLKNNSDREAKAFILYYVGRYVVEGIPVHDVIAAGIEINEENYFERFLNGYGIDVDFDAVRRSNLYVAAEMLIQAFIPVKKTEAYVQYFLDLVLERTVKSQSTIADFLLYWEQNFHKLSIPSPEKEDAVRLMTVHKSKGLEFPVVIYPFADDDFSRSRDKIWIDLEDQPQFAIPKALVDLKNDVKMYGETAQRLYEQKKQEELLDNLNVLYVALTRAEEQLYVISSYKKVKSGNLPNTLASFFVRYLEFLGLFSEEVLSYDFGKPVRVSEKNTEEVRPLIIEAVEKPISPSVIKIAKREALMWDTKQQKAIEKGNLIHELLSRIFTMEDVERVVKSAVSKGEFPFSQQTEITQKIREIVSHQELEMFFTKEHLIYNERPILHKSFTNIKPDRVVVKGNEAWIVDYKTGKEKPIHVKQVNDYAAAIEEMGLHVVKKMLLYIQEDLKIIHL